MKREQRLRRAADFQRVRQLAPRGWPLPLLVLYAAPNGVGSTRIGFTVGKRVGKAVVRNRVKRRLREAVRLRYADLQPGYDVVFVARPPAANATWPELREAVEKSIGRARLWRTAEVPAQ